MSDEQEETIDLNTIRRGIGLLAQELHALIISIIQSHELDF